MHFNWYYLDLKRFGTFLGHVGTHCCLFLECGALPEQAESDLWDRDQHPDPELMPLPSAACDLDWNSLVKAAQEYESKSQRTNTLI